MVINKPYLLFLGDASDQLAAKTAEGVAYWRSQSWWPLVRTMDAALEGSFGIRHGYRQWFAQPACRHP